MYSDCYLVHDIYGSYIFIVDGIFYQNTSPWIQYLLILISWPLLSSFIIFMVCNMFYSSAVLFCFSVCFLNWPLPFSSSPYPTIVLFFFETVFQRLYSLLNFSFSVKGCFLEVGFTIRIPFFPPYSLFYPCSILTLVMIMELSCPTISFHYIHAYVTEFSEKLEYQQAFFTPFFLWLMKNISCKTRHWG